MVGVMFPTYIPGRDPADPQFHPIYAACERHDLPVAFHATVRESIGVARHMENFLAVHTCSHSFEQMLSMCSTVVGGIPELFPRLKLGFLEAGCAWVPYWMERLDEEWEKRPGDAPHLKRKPSEYIRGGRIFISSEPEEALLPWVLEHVGEEIILYASDYPHWDSGYPYTVKTLMERADVTAAQKRKIFYENPSRFYRL
ncbi:MAG: amidohydrolase [Deltaproteobacteria bacterium]|nr:amidohydrolase [Deltaproteobacteria bacterium]